MKKQITNKKNKLKSKTKNQFSSGWDLHGWQVPMAIVSYAAPAMRYQSRGCNQRCQMTDWSKESDNQRCCAIEVNRLLHWLFWLNFIPIEKSTRFSLLFFYSPSQIKQNNEITNWVSLFLFFIRRFNSIGGLENVRYRPTKKEEGQVFSSVDLFWHLHRHLRFA